MANPIVSQITGYVDNSRDELITRAMLGAKSADMFRLMVDVKGPTNLHLLDIQPVIQAGGCNFTASGDTTFSNRLLTPKNLKVNLEWCEENLLGTYAEHAVRVAAGKETLSFEEKWLNGVADSISSQIEKMIYQGDGSNAGEFDGLLKSLQADATVISGETASAETAYAFLKEVAAKIPAEVKDPVILVSIPVYREYMQNLVTANLFHYDPANGADEYMLPGTSIKVVAVPGLNGTSGGDFAIAADLNNIVFGCDAESDSSDFSVWYSFDDQIWKLACKFIAGVQYAYGSEIVLQKRLARG